MKTKAQKNEQKKEKLGESRKLERGNSDPLQSPHWSVIAVQLRRKGNVLDVVDLNCGEQNIGVAEDELHPGKYV